MAHLKHAGPIRRASALKRTALVEILSDTAAANDDLTEQDLREIDTGFAARRAADPFRHAEADAAQAVELQRDPRGGFAS